LQLREIAGLIDAGKLRVFVEEVFPLGQVREAYERAQKGNMQGKVALRVANG
jgi:NADPH:quinone reductase-like Zn-dependent oxidoreductase